VNGGAVVLGHPYGMSGIRYLGSTLLELGRLLSERLPTAPRRSTPGQGSSSEHGQSSGEPCLRPRLGRDIPETAPVGIDPVRGQGPAQAR
jgi:Thiolase, C-terminal domain